MYATAQTIGQRSHTLDMGEARKQKQPEQGVAPTRRTDGGAIITRASIAASRHAAEENLMNNIVYIVGAVVIVLVVLSVLGLR